MKLTETEARKLAEHDRYYSARKIRGDEWCVWDAKSDHVVEFSFSREGE